MSVASIDWSASVVPRLLQCATSALLPHHDYNTEYANEGEDYHADMEAAIDVGDEDAIPAEILALIQEGDETITEMAFAYDPKTDTAREIGRITREEYKAALRPGELPGKLDLAIRGNGRVIVVDHKGFELVDDADRNMQTATYALMVSRAWGFDEVEVWIRYRAPWRKPSHAVLNALDLAVHADRLVRLRSDIEKANETPQLFLNDGPWCKYCPAFLGGCPRQDSLKRLVTNGTMERRLADVMPFADDEEAAVGFEIYERMKTITQRLKAGLYARAAERPVPLRDGKFLGPREKQGNRKIDGEKAYELIREKYGQKVADASVKKEVAQTNIVKALKANGVRGADAKKDALVKQLEEAGAVKRETKTTIEIYDAPRELKAAGQ